MDHSAIEEDLRGVGDAVEFPQGLLEFIAVVVPKGSYPCLDFLVDRSARSQRLCSKQCELTHLFE